MPTLNWLTGSAKIESSTTMTFRSACLTASGVLAQPESGNMLVHVDNLDALKVLLLRYEREFHIILN
ncbi:MAG: hypothetical protein LBP92_05515 [Deltaproteobacteria bacterium]|jgi:hypothetical protein|nr:hypothetical protein [Deltaproteobacteria bacterium]